MTLARASAGRFACASTGDSPFAVQFAHVADIDKQDLAGRSRGLRLIQREGFNLLFCLFNQGFYWCNRHVLIPQGAAVFTRVRSPLQNAAIID